MYGRMYDSEIEETNDEKPKFKHQKQNQINDGKVKICVYDHRLNYS